MHGVTNEHKETFQEEKDSLPVHNNTLKVPLT